MKITRCQIWQFGKIKERTFEFDEGFTLISGNNESGKTTLHTAAAALLFGLERGRGRAAKDDLYKTYRPWGASSVYGGALDWERDGHQIHMERDLSKTPPRAYITDTADGQTRETDAASLPWPPSLSPYLYFNTLSFKQMGSSVEGGMADELRSHIINLECSGDENLDVAAALHSLKSQKKALQKRLRPEAEKQTASLKEELHALGQAGFSEESSDWDEAQAALTEQEAAIEALSEERRLAAAEVSRQQKVLKDLSFEERDAVEKDLKTASELTKQLSVYESDYSEERVSPGTARTLSLLALPFMLLFLWLGLKSFQSQLYLRFVLSVVGFFFAMFVSSRFSRKAEAYSAYEKDLALLKTLFSRYLPDYEARGSAEEAGQLCGYLQKVLGIFDHIEQQEADIKEKTEQLAALADSRNRLSEKLKSELSLKVRRESWETKLRSVMDQLEAWEPIVKENEKLREEIAAIDLAGSTLSSLAEQVYSDFGAPLSETASGIFREVTGGRYEGVRISNSLEIYAVQNHQLIAPGALSGGTMEQLYFSFRMAVIRLLWPHEAMPLFFDDSFAYYDRERLGALLRWLHENYDGQILLFTCQDREEEILREEEIPYRKIELD